MCLNLCVRGKLLLQLSASFIIFPEYKSNNGLRVRLYMQITFLLLTFFNVKGKIYFL